MSRQKKNGDAMRERFGTIQEKCGHCPHFVEYQCGNRKVFKCRAYGVTHSEATDWKKSQTACGLFGQPINGMNSIIDQMRHEKRAVCDPLPGQIGMF